MQPWEPSFVLNHIARWGCVMCACMGFATTSWANTNPSRSPNSVASQCWVADFRELALTTHDVQQREYKAVAWLKTHASQCTDDQLMMISSNRPSWMGNADTVRVAGQIDRELERRFLMSQRGVDALFDSNTEREATTQVTTTPAAPLPVVPATEINTVPAAVIVQPPGGGAN